MAAKLYGAGNAPLKIQFITDTHYYSRKGALRARLTKEPRPRAKRSLRTAIW